ncbi:MAG: AAA family ATPase, partial [Gordonia amarae]
MRLHRLALRDFRGIGEREVRFADEGVTVVEGRNEAGKSSMIEALDMLLKYRDSSKSAAVRSIMPSGRDVGSEVEAEISCGKWHFTYFKRFNKQPATTLTVLEPTPEQLTGRDAHDRVEEILDSTVDRALFDALKLLQSGTDPALTDLSAAAALSRALDRVASSGGDPAGSRGASDPVETEDDTVLLDTVTEEYTRYHTLKQGKPTGELATATARSTAAGERYERLRRGREVLDDDIERLREAVSRRGELQRAAELLRADQEQVDTVWQAAQAVLSKVADAAQNVGHRRTVL